MADTITSNASFLQNLMNQHLTHIGVGGFACLSGFDPAMALLSQDIFDTFTSYPLSVIPMFILMGSFAFASGISERLFATTYAWVGGVRGGLTIATVLACAGFAAICGSTAATAATMGKVALSDPPCVYIQAARVAWSWLAALLAVATAMSARAAVRAAALAASPMPTPSARTKRTSVMPKKPKITFR